MQLRTPAIPFSAGPLAMPSIHLDTGDPSLAPDTEAYVCVPQLAQMPAAKNGNTLWPFLRRVSESCLYGAKAMPPILSNLLNGDNTGPAQLRLNLDGRKVPGFNEESEK